MKLKLIANRWCFVILIVFLRVSFSTFVNKRMMMPSEIPLGSNPNDIQRQLDEQVFIILRTNHLILLSIRILLLHFVCFCLLAISIWSEWLLLSISSRDMSVAFVIKLIWMLAIQTPILLTPLLRSATVAIWICPAHSRRWLTVTTIVMVATIRPRLDINPQIRLHSPDTGMSHTHTL
jgi:hypothetical protein